MQQIYLDKIGQRIRLPSIHIKGEMYWVTNENSTAMLQVSTKAGIGCFLQVSPALHGAFFEFNYNGYTFSFILDHTLMNADKEITAMQFECDEYFSG